MQRTRIAPILLGFGACLAAQGSQAPRANAPAPVPENRPLVLTAALEDQAITPGSVRYLRRVIDLAEDRQAECLVIVLDTPGGLLTSTRTLTRHMLASDIPLVVYVAPSGGRAASAGLFVTLAAHLAAMAPGTTIGAAHPVQLDGFPLDPDGDPSQVNEEVEPPAGEEPPAETRPLEDKIVNDTVAWARALAELRERNADWAVRAVRYSESITAPEAVEEGGVELVADDVEHLLAEIDGRQVVTPRGAMVLNTAEAEIRTVPVWWGERVLMIVSQPNVAFLLMIFGFYAVLFELYSFDWGLSGTLGAICLVLAMFGLAVLPIDLLGLALIVIALGLMVAEVFVTSYGALSLTGAACLVVGAVMLVDDPGELARVSLAIVVPIAAATVGITLLLVGGVIRSYRAPPRTGGEGMVGKTARVVGDFGPHGDAFHGTVAVHGERWRAVSQRPFQANEECRVAGRDGLTLIVEPVSPPS